MAMIETKACDIIIPVYNSFNYVIACIDSVLEHTDYPFRIIVVDDASDTHVQELLLRYANIHHNIQIVRNEKNVGFIKSVNKGILTSSGAFLVILNSDTVVTPGWLRRMIACAISDARIGIVNPISNTAANLSVEIPPGFSIFSINHKIAELSQRQYPDVITAVGFCFLIKRGIIDCFGGFDEIYGRGHCEESDYCMKVVSAGYRVVIADDAFVYHKGSASFGTWLDKYEQNRKIFDERWEHLFRQLYKPIITANPLDYLRKDLMHDLKISRLDISLLKSVWNMAVVAWHGAGFRGIIRRVHLIPSLLFKTARKLIRQLTGCLPSAPIDASVKQNYFVTRDYVAALPVGSGLRIAFLLNRFRATNEMYRFADLTNALIRKGHTVYLVCLSNEADLSALPLYTRPLTYRNLNAMTSFFPKVNLAIALYPGGSQSWLPAIAHKNSGIRTVSYILSSDLDMRSIQPIKGSLENVNHRIVVSQKVKDALDAFGYASHLIPFGVNRNIFYRKDRQLTRGKNILIRPPRPDKDGYVNLVKIVQRVKYARQDLSFTIYGLSKGGFKKSNMSIEYAAHNSVSEPEARAKLLANSDALLDFAPEYDNGLLLLEAAASGIPTVVINRGSHSFLGDGSGIIFVDADNVDGIVNVISKLINCSEVNNTFCRRTAEIMETYSHDDEVERHIELYQEFCTVK